MNSSRAGKPQLDSCASRRKSSTPCARRPISCSTGFQNDPRAIAEEQAAGAKLVDDCRIVLRGSTEIGQRVSSLEYMCPTPKRPAAQQLATAKQAAADTERSAQIAELRTEIRVHSRGAPGTDHESPDAPHDNRADRATHSTISPRGRRTTRRRPSPRAAAERRARRLDDGPDSQTTAKVETLIGSADLGLGINR